MNLEMFTSIVFYSFGVLVIRDLELVTIEIMHHSIVELSIMVTLRIMRYIV